MGNEYEVFHPLLLAAILAETYSISLIIKEVLVLPLFSVQVPRRINLRRRTNYQREMKIALFQLLLDINISYCYMWLLLFAAL